MVGQLTPAYVCRQNVLKIKIYQLDLKCFELQAAGVAFFLLKAVAFIPSIIRCIMRFRQKPHESSEEIFLRIC